MPIRPYLEGRSFDPEMVRIMGVAFENVCRELGLSGQREPLKRVVARTVIDFADANVRDVHRLTAAVMQQFQSRPAAKPTRPPPDSTHEPSAA
jgi:hypothetical protein